MNSPRIHPRKGEGPDARQRSEPSGTATTQHTNCAPAAPNWQEIFNRGSTPARAPVETMVKANELGMVLLLQAEEEIDQTESCSCCGSITAKPLINPRVIIEPDRWVVAFICPKCEDATNDTGGANIKRVSPINTDLIDPTLLAAYKWLDTKLLQRNQHELFIRRPTFAEAEEARAAGFVLPANCAVVVSPCGERGISRRLLPFPFPWRNEQDWWEGPISAQEAVDLVDAIDRGEVDVLEVRGKVMFFASEKVLEGLVAGS